MFFLRQSDHHNKSDSKITCIFMPSSAIQRQSFILERCSLFAGDFGSSTQQHSMLSTCFFHINKKLKSLRFIKKENIMGYPITYAKNMYLINRSNANIPSVFVLIMNMLHNSVQCFLSNLCQWPSHQQRFSDLVQTTPYNVLYHWMRVVQIFLQPTKYDTQ